MLPSWETNIAMENPLFWWYLPGKMGMLMGYVSFREGSSLVRVPHESTNPGPSTTCRTAMLLPDFQDQSQDRGFEVGYLKSANAWSLMLWNNSLLGGGSSNIFLCSSLLGEMIQFDLIFSKGLKPPPRFVWSILFRILETSSIICIWTEIWPFPPNFRDFGSEILSSINFQGVKFQDVSIRRVFVGLLLLSGIIIFAPMSPVIVIASLPILMRL